MIDDIDWLIDRALYIFLLRKKRYNAIYAILLDF